MLWEIAGSGSFMILIPKPSWLVALFPPIHLTFFSTCLVVIGGVLSLKALHICQLEYFRPLVQQKLQKAVFCWNDCRRHLSYEKSGSIIFWSWKVSGLQPGFFAGGASIWGGGGMRLSETAFRVFWRTGYIISTNFTLQSNSLQIHYYILQLFRMTMRDVPIFKQRYFWATHINRKWTFCNIAAWFWPNFQGKSSLWEKRHLKTQW